MKKRLLGIICIFVFIIGSKAQVTQINSNKSLQLVSPLTTTQTIFASVTDSSLWVTDGTLAGTVQITTTIKYEALAGLLSGKLIFRGSTAATGAELYITDGTSAGTVLVKDINPGTTASAPAEFALLNGFIYFDAATVAEGRELWRTNGTNAGTTLVKDIVPGTDSSNAINEYHLFSNGTFLLFAAKTAANGIELWKSDGTNVGTALLLDINTGNAGADSSNPANFYIYNSIVLFSATDATHGNEIWKTDGTAGGTLLVKDINPGTGSSTTLDIFGFSFPLLLGFHTFNNHVYFNASDGTSTGEVWSTDGTTANTTLLKNIVPGLSISVILLIDAVDLPGKFIFPVSDGASRTELWQSDGTPAGTVLFKSFDVISMNGDIPAIFLPYNGNLLSGNFSQTLFQGNKFFFTASTTAAGYELWISDGTLAGTTMVKDIIPGSGNGIDATKSLSYLYTSGELYFAATDATHGNELWKSDGTSGGTSMVADIYTNTGDALPELFLINNSKIFFGATNGDNATATDLYVVNGVFTPLPVKLVDFTVTPLAEDALIKWTTSQEINTNSFTIQRSSDGLNFENVTTVVAAGNTANGHKYSFTDNNILASGGTIIYYRLLTTDTNGKQEVSNTIALKIKPMNWNARLLANPVQQNIQLITSGITANAQMSIKDMSGKMVYSRQLQRINGVESVPVTSLPHGQYIIIITSDGENKSILFIK
ncbi:T9SS type A sorting domain-containing protein [Ferruginibacter paludis]|uniref:T9SS type A sorting domain-containing protein n=1 Tax=Ferruginibacter paludis TaxID=1310417 RepID=UPI0025B4CE84|nr:T9SS type A sorting domain-containing protein [Ferruginibacter paludis]MDN3655010.1 T9SS type A sorting domain-containing protein [Ferruginibacter paludis]